MYTNFLPSLTTSDLLSMLTPIDSNYLTNGFEKINGLELKSMLDTSKSSSSESDHKLKFKLPGYEKTEIKILVDSSEKSKKYTFMEPVGFLKVSVVAQNKEEGTTKLEGYFPKSIDESTIQAKLNNGILILTAKIDPKKSKEREIQIT